MRLLEMPCPFVYRVRVLLSVVRIFDYYRDPLRCLKRFSRNRCVTRGPRESSFLEILLFKGEFRPLRRICPIIDP